MLPVVLRLGAAAAVGFVLSHLVMRGVGPARRDQRAEDAFDDLSEGLSLSHRPEETGHQRNATWRLRRSLRIGDQEWDLDAAALLRLRISRKD